MDKCEDMDLDNLFSFMEAYPLVWKDLFCHIEVLKQL